MDGDLSPLIKSGTPPAEKVTDKWEDLHSEFATKAGGAQMEALMKRLSTVQVLSSKITRIELTVMALRLCPAVQLFEVLSSSGYGLHAARLAADPSPEDYDRILDDVEAQLKPLKMKLEALSEHMPEPQKERKGPAIDEFSDTLRHINEHFKLSLTIDNTNTYDYCGYISDMRRDVQTRIKATAGNNRQSRRKTPAHGAE